MTLDQMFESFRRASVSSMQMQQEMFKQWTQQFPSTPLNAAGVSAEWVNRHRESLDTMYKSLIQVIEQSSRLSDAKTPEDYKRTTEDLRHKMFETFKDQSEAQLRDFQKSAEKWFDVIPSA